MKIRVLARTRLQTFFSSASGASIYHRCQIYYSASHVQFWHKNQCYFNNFAKKHVHFECVRGFMDGVRTSQHRSASDQISEIAAVLVHVCKLLQSVCYFRPTSWIYEAGIKIHAESVIGICYTSKVISTISWNNYVCWEVHRQDIKRVCRGASLLYQCL